MRFERFETMTQNVRYGWKADIRFDSERQMRRALAALILIAVMPVNGCARSSNERITVKRSTDHFSVLIHSERLSGLCYAPASFSPNGNLVLNGFAPRERLHIVRVAPKQVEDIDRILAHRRVRVTSDQVALDIPKETILQERFYLQLVLFDCRANAGNPAPDGNLYLVSALLNPEADASA